MAYKGNIKVRTVRLQTLIIQFETLKMNELEIGDRFIIKVMSIVNQLRINGENEPTNQIVVEKFI